MLHYIVLLILGAAVGAAGTLIGAGGGFLLVPVLLLSYPVEDPTTITSIALAVVFFNALSGSVAYARMGRIDFRSAWLFCLAAIPGAVLGASSTSALSRRVFDIVLGVVLLAGSASLALRSRQPSGSGRIPATGRINRVLTESNGTVHSYSYRPGRGLLISAVVGYASSLLGIGGGILHVPAMIRLLGFPVHVATATSHFLLAIMAFAGTIVHLATGSFQHGYRRALALSVGVVLGAQVGARLSNRVRGQWIVRALAVALALVGMRILFRAIFG